MTEPAGLLARKTRFSINDTAAFLQILDAHGYEVVQLPAPAISDGHIRVYDGEVAAYAGAAVRFVDEDWSPGEARRLAAELLAAADVAETGR